MTASSGSDAWTAGPSYEQFMGRWSRLIAASFLEWLAPKPRLRWLEIGCGTGALTEAVLARGRPASLVAVDPSAEFIRFAKQKLPDPRISFQIGDASSLSLQPFSVDVVVSGLAVNFIPEPVLALDAMRRALRPDGTLAFYVWDYGGRMEMLRYFWDAAVALDPDAGPLDEGIRFPVCQPDALTQLCRQAELRKIEVAGIEAAMAFSGFADYWSPFLGGQGPAPSYVARLDPSSRRALEERLRAALPLRPDGSLSLVARAWAVRASP